MPGLLAKLILCPVTILASDMLFNNVNYGNVYQALIVGAIVALAGYLIEWILLQRGSLWITNITDFVVGFFIVYATQFLLLDTYISFFGAVLVSLLLLLTENAEHLYIIRSGRTEK